MSDTSVNWEELLTEAKQELREQDEQDVNSELGDQIELGENEHFAGRYRGIGKMQTKRGLVDVFLFWGSDGTWRFAYQHSRLLAEMTEKNPNVGDEVLILRGPTRTFEKDGEEHEVFPYVVKVRPCAGPLRDAPVQVAESASVPSTSDIPF